MARIAVGVKTAPKSKVAHALCAKRPSIQQSPERSSSAFARVFPLRAPVLISDS